MPDTPDATEDPRNSPFHDGEQALQARAGVRERMEKIGRAVIRAHLIEQHREFYPLLASVVVGGLDVGGVPCATLLAGPPGFVHAPDAHHLRIEALPTVEDPLRAALSPGAPLAILGLEEHTRRRNRLNGTLAARDAGGFTVAVRQSFGNCPKYIQAREARFTGVSSAAVAPRAGGALLDEPLRTLIEGADTFFIASSSADQGRVDLRGGGLDVSHRGGKPGFVHVAAVAGHSELLVPDFVGNYLFNTLGNLLVEPRCGLLFVDYVGGGLLHLAGRAELDWEGRASRDFAGAERAWRFKVEHSLWRAATLPLRWSAPDPAPQLAATGAWPTGGSA